VISRNCAILDTVQQRTGPGSCWPQGLRPAGLFPVIARTLHGVCASGPIEARLGREDFGREVHTYAPAFSPAQMERVICYSDHIIFNSIGQWHQHRQAVLDSGRRIEIGLRVNPGHSEVEVELYNPCRAVRVSALPRRTSPASISPASTDCTFMPCANRMPMSCPGPGKLRGAFAGFLPGLKW